MTKLFDRTVVLQLGSPEEPGREFRDLRIIFDVKHTLSGGPNEATIEVTNPNPKTIAVAQREDVAVRLFAGYDSTPMIFRGNPVDGGVEVDDEGVDTTLEIEALDGGNALARARVNLSFQQSIPLSQVLSQIATELGLPTGVVRVPPDSDVVLQQGGNFAGQVSDVLDRIAASLDLDISVQNGALQVLPETGDTEVRAAAFSSKNGNLIGFKEKDDGVEVKGLLDGSVRPGHRFQVTRTVGGQLRNSIYKARDVQFKGDSTSGDFFVTIQAREATP